MLKYVCFDQMRFVFIRCSATNPSSYDEVRPTFLSPVKDPVSDTESIPSPSTSPVLTRKHYGESITSLGKASILGMFLCLTDVFSFYSNSDHY